MKRRTSVSHVGSAPGARGAIVKRTLRAHPRDPKWADELRTLRAALHTEERPWSD